MTALCALRIKTALRRLAFVGPSLRGACELEGDWSWGSWESGRLVCWVCWPCWRWSVIGGLVWVLELGEGWSGMAGNAFRSERAVGNPELTWEWVGGW